MMRQNLLPSVCAFLIGWILLEKAAHGCEDQCYKPYITSTNIQRDENNTVIDAVCYSLCALTVRMFATVMLDSHWESAWLFFKDFL